MVIDRKSNVHSDNDTLSYLRFLWLRLAGAPKLVPQLRRILAAFVDAGRSVYFSFHDEVIRTQMIHTSSYPGHSPSCW